MNNEKNNTVILDEIYDGKLNQTVTIDPITNNEVLLKKKKFRSPIFGFLLAILFLTVFFGFINGLDFKRVFNDAYIGIKNIGNSIFNNSQSTIKTTKASINKTLNCLYTSDNSNGVSIKEELIFSYNNDLFETYVQNTTITNLDVNNSGTFNLYIKEFEDFYKAYYGTKGFDIVLEKSPENNSNKIMISSTIYIDVFDFNDLSKYPINNDNKSQYKVKISEKDSIKSYRKQLSGTYTCIEK